jgi:TolB protein
MHDFANRVLKELTGTAGSFGTRLTFARRKGRGRKDVYVASFDGHDVGRVSSGKGIAMLPDFGPGGIWYSKMTPTGMFITRTGTGEKPLIQGNGLNMAPTACNGRIYFTSSRTGNSEIYSARPDGSGIKRITHHRAIDVSPSCGPGGQIAFVSNRHGSPQIFVMDGSGGNIRRVTYKGNHNQTPSWCTNGEDPLIAFTGVSGGTDIFTVNIETQEYTRLTQGQGTNKDPAFSPDCRMVAFYSSRGGIYISSPKGLNQNKVIPGHAETIRWSH